MLSEIIIFIGLLRVFDIANAGEAMSSEDSSLLRGTQIDPSLGRRLTVSNQECTLYKVSIEYNSAIAYSGNTNLENEKEEEWHCELDKAYARDILGLDDPLVRLDGWMPTQPVSFAGAQLEDGGLEDEADFNMFDRIESGKSTMQISQGIIDRSTQNMHVESASAKVKSNNRRRKLESAEIIPKVGIKKTIVVRIMTNDSNIVPENRALGIKQTLFEDDVSLKKQYEKCSYNKFKIQPFNGTTITNVVVEDGVVNVRLNAVQSNEIKRLLLNNGGELKSENQRQSLTYWSRYQTEKMLGDLESQFDYVIMIMPRGISGFLAMATIGRFDSYFTQKWITRPSFPLHEIGHNIGMDHSGEDESYDDKVGYMGFSYDDKDGPAMCFNPANSFYLGWYQAQSDSYDAYDSGDGRRFILNGVVDYNPEKSGSGDDKRLVVLQLTQSRKDWDYYIGYNRKEGMNSQTSENGNEVLILKKNGPADGSFTTKKIATLSEIGTYYEIEQYNEDRSVFILFESLFSDGRDAFIVVSTVRPTTAPTGMPTPQPTIPDGIYDIYDRDDLRYNGNKNKDCDWVSRNRELRCSLMARRLSVKNYWCPKTCEFAASSNLNCKGRDRDNFGYRKNPELNCAWVSEDRIKRCPKKWKGRRIADNWCPETCDGLCNGSRKKNLKKNPGLIL